jgi:methylmalonyl-CoA mutase C-terminal domain/subunit
MALVPRVRQLMDENGLQDIALVVGGIIPDEDMVALKAAGVSAVFGPGTSTEDIIVHIRQVVATKGGFNG